MLIRFTHEIKMGFCKRQGIRLSGRCTPALDVAVLTRQPAGKPLGHLESILQNTHGSAVALRDQKFPSADAYG